MITGVRGVTAATEGAGMGVTTEVDPGPPKRIAPKIARAMINTPPTIAPIISLRFGGSAGGGGGGRAEGGVAGGDTGTLAGRPAAPIFSLSARQNSVQLGTH